MTNVLRTLGKGPAALVTVGDFCKGMLAVFLGHLILQFLGNGIPFYADYLIALLVMLGHCFPLFYGFRGGKGIFGFRRRDSGTGLEGPADYLRYFFGGCPSDQNGFIGVYFCSGDVPYCNFDRQPIGKGPSPGIGYLGCPWSSAGWLSLCTAPNIKRLLNGTENKFGSKRSSWFMSISS